ncbi:hypothetical protein WAF17_12585 [Bernardetia sp. ABR2-2B]|uniref:hypothetical protein n=1 Tax=Bernardetia sp. ABR2-2B TaxID=3127472 RepID=UPI0030D00DB2
MKNLAQKIENPKYHNSIRYFAHLLESEERYDFILKISEHNIFLAAQTATTCAYDKKLAQQLITQAQEIGGKAKERQEVSVEAILALITFKKYIEAFDLFYIEDENTKKYKNGVITHLDDENIAQADVFAILIGLSPNYKVAYDFYKSLLELKIHPNEIVYNNLAGKSPDYETALHWFKESQEKNLEIDIDIYNNLISQSLDYKTALHWFKESQEKGLEPTITTYNNLISKTPDYRTALNWFDESQEKKLEPIVEMYNILITKSTDYRTVLNWFRESQEKDLELTMTTYNNLIGKSPDYRTALNWLEESQKKNLKSDIDTYNNLIGKSPDYKTALRWFKENQEKKLKSSIHIYHNMIANCIHIQDKKYRYSTAKKYYSLLLQEYQKTSIIGTYQFMIRHAPNYIEAKKYFKDLEKAGFQADAPTFETMLSKKPTFKEKMKLKRMMKERGITLDKSKGEENNDALESFLQKLKNMKG